MECVGRNISYGVLGDGYKSLYGPTTSIISTVGVISCGGALSCYDISIFTATSRIECLGTYSCSNINGNSYIQTSRHDVKYPINCQGSNSCQNTKIRPFNNSLRFIGCYGDQSCAYSDIQNVKNIHGSGAYSLLYATIDSNLSNSNELIVYLSGYHAGFGATIICHDGDNCTIECFNNGCHMLYLQCLGDNNCFIDIKSSDTVEPITNITEFNATALHLLYNSTATSSSNDESCNLPNNHYVYDNAWQHSTDIISISNNTNSIDPICCRGKESCSNISNIVTTNDIICSGGRACEERVTDKYGPVISTIGSVYCEAFAACSGSTINSTNNVYCLGAYSCEQSIIYNTKNVYCSGIMSCNYTTIYSNGNNVNLYLLGQHHPANVLNIHCNQQDICSIYCWGYRSCSSTTVCTGTGNCIIECNLDTGCPITTTAIPTTSFPTMPSINPTTGPSEASTTESPTKYPSTQPTRVPINCDSDNCSPERATTTSPTNHPSTSDPTTYLPTTNQPSTVIPTTYPISNKSFIMFSTTIYTTSELVMTTLFTSETLPIIEIPSFMITVCIIATFLLFGLISLIDARVCRRNDYFVVGSVITASFEVADTVSDILFALYLTFQYNANNDVHFLILMIASYIFIIIPISFSIYQLVQKARTKWRKDDINVRSWLRDYSKALYLLSLLTGSSYTAIQIVNCEAFALEIFCMGLKNREKMYFNTKRIYGVVCFENIPQIAIQIWYLIQIGIDVVPICSIIFSFISIILTVSTLLTQRTIIGNETFLKITFDIISNDITPKLTRKTKGIKSALARELGINFKLIDIPRPQNISVRGVTFEIELATDNMDLEILDHKTRLNNAKNNGRLAKIIQQQWNVHVNIAQLESEVIESEKQKKNTVLIKLDPEMQLKSNNSRQIQNEIQLANINVNDIEMPHIINVQTTPGGYIQEEESEESQI